MKDLNEKSTHLAHVTQLANHFVNEFSFINVPILLVPKAKANTY